MSKIFNEESVRVNRKEEGGRGRGKGEGEGGKGVGGRLREKGEG